MLYGQQSGRTAATGPNVGMDRAPGSLHVWNDDSQPSQLQALLLESWGGLPVSNSAGPLHGLEQPPSTPSGRSVVQATCSGQADLADGCFSDRKEG